MKFKKIKYILYISLFLGFCAQANARSRNYSFCPTESLADSNLSENLNELNNADKKNIVKECLKNGARGLYDSTIGSIVDLAKMLQRVASGGPVFDEKLSEGEMEFTKEVKAEIARTYKKSGGDPKSVRGLNQATIVARAMHNQFKKKSKKEQIETLCLVVGEVSGMAAMVAAGAASGNVVPWYVKPLQTVKLLGIGSKVSTATTTMKNVSLGAKTKTVLNALVVGNMAGGAFRTSKVARKGIVETYDTLDQVATTIDDANSDKGLSDIIKERKAQKKK